MKKGLLILISLGLVLPLLVSAITIENPLEAKTFEDLVNAIIHFIFIVAVALAPLMILIGAFYIMSAGGDPKRVETGKKIILYALIGFAIILFAKGLVAILESILGVK